jgi:uncharacterized membrane protein YsdA (DUF1294 family)
MISLKNTPINTLIVALVFFIIMGILVFLEQLSLFIFIWYIGLSLVTFLIYAVDKSAARKDKWRTPENTLHLLSLCGGWSGAMLAQQFLRHKSQKQPFRLIFWISLFINLVLLLWFILK